jgi:hypothetical protein
MSDAKTRTLEVTLHSHWHVGSGHGDGPGADALVVRTSHGLPLLPGKTLKGLLRDACRLTENLGHLPKGTTLRLFGGAEAGIGKAEPGTERFATTPGSLLVGSAEMGLSQSQRQGWRDWAEQCPGEVSTLFDTFHSTALDETGVVLDHSLRSIEYAVPVNLSAELEGPEKDLTLLPVFLPLIRELGLRRRRGFGRCELRLKEVL